MGAAESAVRKASGRVEWMRDANVEPVAWHPYSDIENLIIEEAFVAEQTQAMLDGYHIDFQRSIQISNCDASEERPVKRMVRDRNELHLREDRFTTNPIAPDPPFGVQYGFVSPFIREVLKQLDLTRDRLPSKDKTTVAMVLDKAVLGIIEEGGKQGRQCEAEYIGDLLRTNRRKGIKTIWKCCAHLYSLDSFLHKTLNDTMRLIGSPEHEEIWRCKIPTLGPFCLLLWDNPHNKTMIRPGTILYRGMKLSDDIITSFKDESLRSSKLWHTFQAFTSCSRNRTFAEQFGNVLFIMKTLIAFTIDLSPLSEYGFEEEELLYPAVSFTVDRVESSDSNDKHVFYVTLQHKHRSESIEILFFESFQKNPADRS